MRPNYQGNLIHLKRYAIGHLVSSRLLLLYIILLQVYVFHFLGFKIGVRKKQNTKKKGRRRRRNQNRAHITTKIYVIGLFASCTPLILCLIYGKQWTNRSRFFCIHKTSINVGWKEGHGQTDWNNIYLYLLRERERERKKIVNGWIIQRPYAFLGQSESQYYFMAKFSLLREKLLVREVIILIAI